MSENSHVKEHCSVYTLSDKTEIEFRQQCDHDHDERCEECEMIESTMKDIEELLSRAPYPSDDDRDEALYLFHTACHPYLEMPPVEKCSTRQSKAGCYRSPE